VVVSGSVVVGDSSVMVVGSSVLVIGSLVLLMGSSVVVIGSSVVVGAIVVVSTIVAKRDSDISQSQVSGGQVASTEQSTRSKHRNTCDWIIHTQCYLYHKCYSF